MNEVELVAKYKTIKIVRGSLKKGSGHHKSKNVVKVVCKCGATQIVATSDLWLKNCCKCGEKINRPEHERPSNERTNNQDRRVRHGRNLRRLEGRLPSLQGQADPDEHPRIISLGL